MGTVKQVPDVMCMKCGFCCQHNAEKQEYHELTKPYREKGYLAQGCGLHCMKGLAGLQRETSLESGLKGDQNMRVLVILNNPRKCTGFFSYIPGYGPRGHDAFEREEQRKREALELLAEERRANAEKEKTQREFNEGLVDKQIEFNRRQNFWLFRF
ncbi:hypothetical protein KIH39_12720 [Telmatocola sphagniphila]|uniref:Uncharacterized protein n=1 Tax=Telmatocola sphagniphila TaxID=1123043 RepID=A0A8E6BD58_9BACT|nr:hypothetical protein [Telmatocola sphagniphila]QVL34730.1 hypothetical protein KIH39_12720 [Telmatocola sphagniphila]